MQPVLCRPQTVRSCMVTVCDRGVDTPLCQAPTASSPAGLAQQRPKARQMVQPLGTTVSSVQGGDIAAFLTPPEGEEELWQEAVQDLSSSGRFQLQLHIVIRWPQEPT